VRVKSIMDVRVADCSAVVRHNVMFSAGWRWGTTSSAAFTIPASWGVMLFLCKVLHVTSLLQTITGHRDCLITDIDSKSVVRNECYSGLFCYKEQSDCLHGTRLLRVCWFCYCIRGVSKIFRTDAVKIIKLTIRHIGAHHPRSNSLLHVETYATFSSIFGTLPGSPFLSQCQALSSIRPGSPQ
jgi:hypothetical protein